MKNSLFLLLSIIAFAGIAQTKVSFPIHFQHFVGKDTLRLDTVQYQNEFHQSYNITNFKYYIGNIWLKKSDGTSFVSHEYFLIQADEEETQNIILKDVPIGKYTSIEFIIGVDSLHNCSGAQSGALDPVNAMFWTWNTGYIFLKLEGKSPASTSPGGFFEYHIGGFKSPHNAIRKVVLDLPQDYTLSTKNESSLQLGVDAAEILKNPTNIDFSTLSAVTDLLNATLIANNYVDMFRVLPLKND